MTETKVLFWHRRDLRMHDNAGLYYALKAGKVSAVFIFDSTILSHLPVNDQRILFIHKSIQKLKEAYQRAGSDLLVLHGDPLKLIPEISKQIAADHVMANADYEPAAIKRDQAVAKALKAQGMKLSVIKDQVIFDPQEVLKADGKPYTVFTPYAKTWKAKLRNNQSGFYLKPYPVENYLNQLQKLTIDEIPTLESLGFDSDQRQEFPPDSTSDQLIKQYALQRDIPSLEATSRLSVHLRFGTISIRALASQAIKHNEVFLNELIWREFYQMILYHYPHSANQAFKPAYDRIPWEHNEQHFKAWCAGLTGYPLVDAGMRQLNETGFMHNRVRMVTASFLCKHLLLDWRLGERYFAEKLLDFELASNAGGWQWAASSGCDAAPYFRVFNPELQQQKFDPEFKYIKKWVPEFGTGNYPKPIVDHATARLKVISRYKEALRS